MQRNRSMVIDAKAASRLEWRKSRACKAGNCFEVAQVNNGGIAIRNSSDLMATPIVFGKVEFAEFLAGVRAGDFDDLLP